MITTTADQKVLGYLGRALSLELSAVQLYSTQAQLLSSWGLNEAASSLRQEAQEELQHADRIIARMLALNVAPGGSQLRPVRLAGDLAGLLRIDAEFESELIGLYEAATGHCAVVGDHDGRLFFETLLEEEQQHLAQLQRWLQRLQGLPAAGQAGNSGR